MICILPKTLPHLDFFLICRGDIQNTEPSAKFRGTNKSENMFWLTMEKDLEPPLPSSLFRLYNITALSGGGPDLPHLGETMIGGGSGGIGFVGALAIYHWLFN